MEEPEHGFQFLRSDRIASDPAVVGTESDTDKAFLMTDADQADDSLVVSW